MDRHLIWIAASAWLAAHAALAQAPARSATGAAPVPDPCNPMGNDSTNCRSTPGNDSTGQNIDTLQPPDPAIATPAPLNAPPPLAPPSTQAVTPPPLTPRSTGAVTAPPPLTPPATSTPPPSTQPVTPPPPMQPSAQPVTPPPAQSAPSPRRR